MRKDRKWFTGKIAAIGVFFLLAGNTGIVLAAQNGAVDMNGAKELALLDAGISAGTAEHLKTKAEREKGENVYEVSFIADGAEYEYLIRESDGAILEWEIDGRNVNDAVAEKSQPTGQQDEEKNAADDDRTRQKSNVLIGLEEAKTVALSDVGAAEDDVIFSTLKYEKNEHRTVYEVEFYRGNEEYEYEIDAYSGEILKIDRD